MNHKVFKPIAIVVLFFFSWTFAGICNFAYAIDNLPDTPPQNQSTQTPKPEEKFQKTIEDIGAILDDQSIDTATKKAKIKAKKEEIGSLDVEIKKQFAETEKKLKDANLPDEILQRHYKFTKHYEDNLNEMKTNLDAIEKASNEAEFKDNVEKTKAHLERTKPPKRHIPLDPNKLPNRAQKLERKEPRLKKEDFEKDFGTKVASQSQAKPILVASNGSLKGLLSSDYESQPSVLIAQTTNQPTPDDLAQNIEVQSTPEIIAKAQELGNNPVKIYNWVRNNIEFVPTYGSIQGAHMTLLTKQGNAFDTASLLIALLRVSNIHARYVYGTIELPIEEVINWVGGFIDANAALDFIASGGIPITGIISGGKVTKVRMEHVWVEAWVDYIPSRGARHKTGQGDTWIPLDASYKQYTCTQGIDIKTAVPFDTQSFTDQIKSTTTINEAEGYITNMNSIFIQQTMQNYQTSVQNYINQNHPGATVEDILGKKEIIKQEFPHLLGTLPYRLIVKGAQYATIPDSLRYKISFQVVNPLTFGTDLDLMLSLPELTGKRITLSFSPATAQDKNLILSYGDAVNLPAYMINLKPELKIDGTIKAVGTTISMGSTEKFTMAFLPPNGQSESISNQVVAGEYYAIALDYNKVTQSLVQNRINRLSDTEALFRSGQLNQIGLDDVIGEVLYSLALTYFYELDTINELHAKSLKVASMRIPSVGMISQGLTLSYVFSMPYSAATGSLNIDVDRDAQVLTSLEGDSLKRKNYALESGMTGSALEHGIFEQIYKIEGISAVKAIGIANDRGIPIYQITNENVDQILPQLQVSYEVKIDISNSVNAGKTVVIPRANINYLNWTGVGYIITNPDTGSAAYMISGGIAGGALLTRAFDLVSSLLVPPAEASDGTKNEQLVSLNIGLEIWHILDEIVVVLSILAIFTFLFAALLSFPLSIGFLVILYKILILIFLFTLAIAYIAKKNQP